MRFEDPNNLDKSFRIVLRAFDKGVTYFDIAPHYSNDKSEDIMGMQLK
jgi:aryl-alcohol dehydrogenase-like predicted oxidoreductase